jgi:hypothetical protein
MGECCQFCGKPLEETGGKKVWYSGMEWMCEGCGADHIRLARDAEAFKQAATTALSAAWDFCQELARDVTSATHAEARWYSGKHKKAFRAVEEAMLLNSLPVQIGEKCEEE